MALKPDHFRAFKLMGSALYALGDFEGAKAALKESLKWVDWSGAAGREAQLNCFAFLHAQRPACITFACQPDLHPEAALFPALCPAFSAPLLPCRLKPDYADALCDLGCTYCAQVTSVAA